MKKGIRLGLLITGLLLIAAVSALFLIRNEPWISAESSFKKGNEQFKNGQYLRAFDYVKKASDKESENAKYAWAATQMAVAAKNANAAYFYAQRSWKDGRKERDVLQALVQFSFFSDKNQKLEYALSLVNKMGDNVDKDDLRAELYAGFGEIAKARKIWEEMFEKSPVPTTAVKVARIYLKDGNDTLAFNFLQTCRTNQKLNDEGYGLLARLYTKRGNLPEAELCYKEGTETFSASNKLQADHALFLMSTKNFDQAGLMLDSLILKYPDSKTFETMRISVLMSKGDFVGALKECDNSKAPIGTISAIRAKIMVRLNRLAEAEAAYDTAIAHSPDIRLRLEFGNFLLNGLRKSEKAQAIFKMVHDAIPSEPVSNLGLATLAIDAKDPVLARKYLDAVLAGKQVPAYSYLLLAQVNLLEKKPQLAIDNCNKVLSTIPGFVKALYVQSLAFSELGRLDKSDEILSALIKSAGNNSANANWVKRALVPVKIKEKKYGDALTLLNDLERSGSSLDIRKIRFEVYVMSGDFSKAQGQLASLKSEISANDYSSYQSWLAELSGDTLKAIAILESNLSSKSNYMRWAGLCLLANKFKKFLGTAIEDSMTVVDWSRLAAVAEKNKNYAVSSQCYERALKHEPDNGVIINNFAWATMQEPGFNQDEVLKAAKKAYLSLSGRSEALQTYAEALNKCGKPGECIKLLQDKPAESKGSANLLCQLGSAYEKTGDLRGALSSYRMVLAFKETALDWPSGFSRQDLEAKVAKYKEQLK